MRFWQTSRNDWLMTERSGAGCGDVQNAVAGGSVLMQEYGQFVNAASLGFASVWSGDLGAESFLLGAAEAQAGIPGFCDIM